MEVFVDKVEILLGGHLLRNGSKAAEVGKHDRHFGADMIPQIDLGDGGLFQELQVLLWDKA